MTTEPNETGTRDRPPRPPRCPICGKPPIDRYRPFCSKRCAEIDLHRWFTGAYAIPVVEDDEKVEDGEEAGET
jgi:uncharacterized protein